MCGLLAFVAAVAGAEPSSSGHAAAEAIAQASHLMRHRGPDEPGTWADPDGTVVFGFNRLSIIDIAHSHQPLRWGPPESPGRYELVFNGEIYNYLELRAELAVRHRRRRIVLCPRPFRYQTAVRGDRNRWHRGGQRKEMSAGAG